MEAVDRAIALDNGAPRNHTVLGLCSWDVDDMWLSAIDRRELGKGGVAGWWLWCCLLFAVCAECLEIDARLSLLWAYNHSQTTFLVIVT
eukprot:scaffold16521_cov66-Cyclotella_meneghiniana.AAC.15